MVTNGYQTEKEETAVAKTNYNFRRANFEAMRAELDDERLEHLIVNSDAAQGFELPKSLNLVGDISQRNTLPSITHHGSTMMSSSPSQDVREPMMKERGTTLTKYFTARRLVKRAVKQAKRNKEINVARLCKTNPKGFYSYINERRIIIIYHDFLPTPRRGSYVKSGKTHTQSSRYIP